MTDRCVPVTPGYESLKNFETELEHAVISASVPSNPAGSDGAIIAGLLSKFGAFCFRVARYNFGFTEFGRDDLLESYHFFDDYFFFGNHSFWYGLVFRSDEAAVQLAAAREFELGSGSAEVRLAESATCYRWCRIHFVRIGQGEVHHTLSGTVVEITAERVALEQLAHKDRLALLGEASAAFAHEVCHALATASTRLLSLDNELDEGQCGPAIRTSVIYALEQVQRAQRVTERTRTFGSAGQHTLEPVNIKSFLTAFIAHHHSISGRMRLDIQIDCPDDLPCIDADPIGLEQVFSNLCKNTLDKYVEQGIAADYRALRISVQNVQGVVKITCSDQAGGLSKEALDRVFQAFLTTKSVRSGTGLGLYISAKLIHAMGGRILCMNRGAGAEFEIYLPIVAE